MRININGIWYNSENYPIQIELSESDKLNISNMDRSCFNYICYPSPLTSTDVKAILKI